MKKRLSILLVLLVLSSPILISSCGSSGGGGGATKSPSGLTSEQIAQFGTSPVLADTDGDGINDDREVNELGFDPGINPYRFNPLVADVPRLGLVRSPPSVRLFLTDALAETKTFEVDRTYQTTVDVIQSVTDTVTESISLAQDTAVDTTFTNGVAGDVTITSSILKTMSEAVEIDFTKEQSVENRKIVTEIEAYEKDHTITASGGLIKFTVEIENRGDVAFQVTTLVLSVVMPDHSHPGKFIPVANLVPETIPPFYDPYPPYVIPPGGKFPAVVYVNTTLDLNTAKELLRDANSLIVSVAGLELLDADGVPFAFRFQDINSRTAEVVIDYAGLRPPERYLVATNADPNNPVITAGHALKDILRIPVEAGPIDFGGQQKLGLLGLRNDPNIRADKQKNAFWQVVRIRGSGASRQVTRFNMLVKDYDFENIPLKAGDALFLVYMEDKDGDGIFSRQERLLGTSDLLADTDGDGWTDFYEINVSHTDPNNPDTDGDGVIDSKDSAPLDKNIQ